MEFVNGVVSLGEFVANGRRNRTVDVEIVNPSPNTAREVHLAVEYGAWKASLSLAAVEASQTQSIAFPIPNEVTTGGAARVAMRYVDVDGVSHTVNAPDLTVDDLLHQD